MKELLSRWRLWPWWKHSVGMAAYFTMLTSVFDLSDFSRDWRRAVVRHIVQGIDFAAIMGPITTHLGARSRIEAALDAGDRSASGAISPDSPLPADLDGRRARRIAEFEVRLSRSPALVWVIVVALLALLLGMATRSAWSLWWEGSVPLAALVVWMWWRPRWLQRRLASLSAPLPLQAGGSSPPPEDQRPVRASSSD